jgi:tRNA-splicing ligase RtcB (3'-phosphate/5'-hydroxy nucleic acid ligase)
MRRADPYQERARELSVEAGIDPDSRIDRPGQRSMPAWCAYRDAARKEHLAREATLAAQDIASLRPQDAQYRNSPPKSVRRA